jgi:hypothetical protein
MVWDYVIALLLGSGLDSFPFYLSSTALHRPSTAIPSCSSTR